MIAGLLTGLLNSNVVTHLPPSAPAHQVSGLLMSMEHQTGDQALLLRGGAHQHHPSSTSPSTPPSPVRLPILVDRIPVKNFYLQDFERKMTDNGVSSNRTSPASELDDCPVESIPGVNFQVTGSPLSEDVMIVGQPTTALAIINHVLGPTHTGQTVGHQQYQVTVLLPGTPDGCISVPPPARLDMTELRHLVMTEQSFYPSTSWELPQHVEGGPVMQTSSTDISLMSEVRIAELDTESAMKCNGLSVTDQPSDLVVILVHDFGDSVRHATSIGTDLHLQLENSLTTDQETLIDKADPVVVAGGFVAAITGTILLLVTLLSCCDPGSRVPRYGDERIYTSETQGSLKLLCGALLRMVFPTRSAFLIQMLAVIFIPSAVPSIVVWFILLLWDTCGPRLYQTVTNIICRPRPLTKPSPSRMVPAAKPTFPRAKFLWCSLISTALALPAITVLCELHRDHPVISLGFAVSLWFAFTFGFYLLGWLQTPDHKQAEQAADTTNAPSSWSRHQESRRLEPRLKFTSLPMYCNGQDVIVGCFESADDC